MSNLIYALSVHRKRQRWRKKCLRQMRRDGLLPRDYTIPTVVVAAAAALTFTVLFCAWWLGLY